MKRDRMETARMMRERALRRASNLFNIHGVPVGDDAEHERDVAYVANLFTISAALMEAAIEEAI